MSKPACPSCKSTDMAVSGLVSYRWSRGKLRPQRGTEEIADGAPWTCNGCGLTWDGDYDDPSELTPARWHNGVTQ